MNAPNMTLIRDTFNRVAKVDFDSGAVPDIETAIARLTKHRIGVRVGPEVKSNPAHQAALLTVVNITHRFALGGVTVEGDLDAPLLVMGRREGGLARAVLSLGGRMGQVAEGVPTIQVGSVCPYTGRGVVATFAGWRGGVVPVGAPRLSEETSVIPAAVLAGALAASEAFAMLRGEVEAGYRSIGVSLWRPDREVDWYCPTESEPLLGALPDNLWVLGLGHLGQAFLWALTMCPYEDFTKVRLVLQDSDTVTESTVSTSILTSREMVGAKKTRAVASVLEGHGFQTTLIERSFDGAFRHRGTDDPAILVCGVDNILARSQLESPGFRFVVEAGLGDSYQDFRSMRLHTFPSSRKATDIWTPGAITVARDLNRAGYRRLSEAGADICGLTRLAETAVGAPFVGTVAGCLMLSQVLRLVAGDAPDSLVDLDLKSFASRRAIRNDVVQMFNPGFQLITPFGDSDLVS